MKTMLPILIGVGLALSGASANAQPASNQQVKLEIESQLLRDALNEWAQQTGFQLVSPSSDVTSQFVVSSIKGTLSPQAALERLLTDTSLTYEWLSERVVAVRERSKPAVSSASWLTIVDQSAPPRLRLAYLGDDSRGDEQIAQSSTPGTDRQNAPNSSPIADPIDEIVVTGTYIRGVVAAGSSVRTYSREDIEQSGATTMEQFARQMTENFSSADTVANSDSNVGFSQFGASSNPFAGAAFNLRGLGTTSTLTLLNGRRLAQGGMDGGLTDISQIPLSAVHHIEILTDGASAIYGADAIAGVVNIVSRKDFSGAETSARYGSATNDSAIGVNLSQLLGQSWSTGHAFLTYEYDKQNGLDASQRSYIADQGGPYSLLPESRRNSVFLSGAQDLGTRTTISADALYSDREFSNLSTSINDFFSQSSASSGDVKQTGATLAFVRALFSDWRADLAGSYSKLEQESSSEVAASFGSSSLARRTNSEIRDLSLTASGSLASLPGGAIKLAMGVSYATQEFDSVQDTEFAGLAFSNRLPELERDVRSAYGELFVPLVGPGNAMAWAKRLELSAAARHDDYTDFGSTTNPKFGLRWEPVSGLALRSTYGTSFRASLLSQLGTPSTAFTMIVPDPQSPGGLADTLILGGGNQNLSPEESTSFTAGIDWTPSGIPHLSIGATYFQIDFKDRIALPPVVGINPLTDAASAPFVTRNPSLAEVQAIFDSPGFLFDGTGQGAAGVTAMYDGRIANIAATKQSGIDFTTRYDLATEFGRFGFSLQVSRLLKNDYQTVPMVPYITLLDSFGQPTKWKGRGRADWARGAFAAAISIGHVNSYDNSLFVPAQTIHSWTTGDLYLSYNTNDAEFGALLRDLTISLNVNNVTDEKPPYVQIPADILPPGQRSLPLDPTNASPVGRFVSLMVTKRW